MGVLLRIMLVLLLLLSVAALIVGLDLFQQREVLKGRLQMAENTLIDVARTIEDEDADDLAQRELALLRLDRDRLRRFHQVDALGKPVRDAEGRKIPSGPGTMHELLGILRGRAAVQYARLNDTRDELTQTRLDLAATRQQLTETQGKLAQTERQLEQAQADLTAARNTIREQNERIAELTGDKERMQAEIEEQREQINEFQDEIATLRMEREQDAHRIAKLMEDLRRLMERESGPEGPEVIGRGDVTQGQKGRVLLVNSDWNFVILDLNLEPDDRSIRPGLVLFVQREVELVGKVRISEIKGDDRRLAIADIMGDWLQMPMREGDHVFF